MEFESKLIPDSRDFVEDFLDGLDDEVSFKILDKMSNLSQLTFLELARAEHIKKIDGDVWEVRIPIKRECYRFLSYIEHQTIFMVHAIKKKTQKLKRKDIDIAQERIKLVKENNIDKIK